MPPPAAGIKSAPVDTTAPLLVRMRANQSPADTSNGLPVAAGFPSSHKADPRSPMTTPQVREYFIQGVTKEGKTFRPSDWAERLCGVMAQFRPEGDTGDPRLTYSPYVRPVIVAGVKNVVVDTRLRDIEPKALDFVLNFARDNNLQVVEACSVDN